MHCAHALGNAIVGDYTYTGDSETERMYLDAHRIVLPDGKIGSLPFLGLCQG